MVTDAVKKHREVLAYALLGVAALYLLSGLSLLFKSSSDLTSLGIYPSFGDKAATFGYLFSDSMLVFPLLASIVLVVAFGERSKNAKIVVMVGLAVGGLALLFALICFFGAFGSHIQGAGIVGGVFGAGKVVGTLLGLAKLTLLVIVDLFVAMVYRSFPKPARSPAAAQQGWGQQGRGQQGRGQQGWGGQQGYEQGQSWGQQGSDPGWAGTGWGEQSQGQSRQQGRPASAWAQPDPGEAPEGAGPPGWGRPGPSSTERSMDQSPGSHEDPQAAQRRPPPPEEGTQVWGPPEQDPSPAHDDDEQSPGEPPRQGGWWQQPPR